MKFEVTARDSSGTTRTFAVEARGRMEALAVVKERKMLAISIRELREKGALPPRFSPKWLRPMTGLEAELALRQLSSMLRSGLALLAAISTVVEQSVSARAKRVWMRVRDDVFAGSSFAQALAAHPRRFDEMTVRLAEVGEKSGELENAVARAADQMESRRSLRTAVVNALAYPSLAVAMAVGVSAYLVVAVIPRLAEFLRSGGTALPPITQALMDFSDWIARNGLFVLAWIGAAAAAWAAVRLFERGHEAEDALLLRLPVTGRILRLSGTALFARSMQIMAQSGVTLVDSLDVGARLLGNRRLRRRVERAREGVLRGLSLESALAEAAEFTPMLRSMAATGEAGGTLPEAFGETARFHEMLLALAIRRFGMVMEPLMIVVTGLIVGFVYIAFFMALFAMAGST